MATASLIVAHFLRLKENILVTRRDLLNYGTQAAVDSALQRLIEAKKIVRMAWGVYVRPHRLEPLPTAEQVAQKKVAAFDRKKLPSAQTEAHNHNLSPHEEILIFEVDASTSSFRIFGSSDRGDCIVQLKAVVARKVQLASTPAQRAIKALWWLGQDVCSPKLISRATANFLSSDRREFHQSHRRMPGWMSDVVHTTWPQFRASP